MAYLVKGLRKVDLDEFPDCCYVCQNYVVDNLNYCTNYCDLMGCTMNAKNVHINTVCDEFERGECEMVLVPLKRG